MPIGPPPDNLTASPGEISSFCDQLYEEFHDDEGRNRRGESRRTVSVPALIQPVNDEYKPVGPAFPAVTRDISRGGLGFFVAQPLGCCRVAVYMTTPTGRHLNVAAEIQHETPFGVFYFSGARFLP